MNYLSQKISDLTAFLTTREKESLHAEFCSGARLESTAETTIETIHEAVRKIETIYYTTSKLVPINNRKGQNVVFYIGDTDEFCFHPENLNVFEQTCEIHGRIPLDIKKLCKKEQIGRLMRLQYFRQNTCCAYNKNDEVLNI